MNLNTIQKLKNTSSKNIAFAMALFMVMAALSPFLMIKEVTARKIVPPQMSHVTGVTAGNGKGTIALSRTGFADTDITDKTLAFGRSTQVTLTATPHSNGSSFEGWSGDACVGSTDPCTLTPGINGKTVVATFLHPSAKYDIEHPKTKYTENGVTVEFNDALPTLPTSAIGINIAASPVGSETLTELEETTTGVVRTYGIEATNQLSELVTTGFSANLTFGYPAANDVDEARYVAAYWDGTKWSSEGITNTQIDTASNKITFTTTHFSDFSVISDGKITANTAGTTQQTVKNSGILPIAGMDWANIVINIVALVLLAACLVLYRLEQRVDRLEERMKAKISKKS